MRKLSIVIPVYNVEDYLRKCLDSVLYPELAEYEVIAVNDGSTDGSLGILREYEAKFPGLFRSVTTENGGLGHARNVGLALARGEYIQFLDSDDSLSPGAVPEILALLDGSFDLAIFDMQSVTETGRELGLCKGCGHSGSFTLAEYPALLFEPPNACNKLFRRSLFPEGGLRFPNRMWFEDLATVPRLYPEAAVIRYVERPWYRYLQRSGSITNSSNPQRNLEIITALDMTIGAYREKGLYDRYREELTYMAVYHQLLTSNTRVNLIDPQSPVQDALVEDFLEKFPDYRQNRYVQAMRPDYKMLVLLIVHKRRWALNAAMRANNLIKRKNS